MASNVSGHGTKIRNTQSAIGSFTGQRGGLQLPHQKLERRQAKLARLKDTKETLTSNKSRIVPKRRKDASEKPKIGHLQGNFEGKREQATLNKAQVEQRVRSKKEGR